MEVLMADQPSGKRKPPISVADAVGQIGAAGSVAGLAQIAALDFADELAQAKSNRLRREMARLARRYGADAPEARAAAERSDQHDAYVRALKVEQKRAAVPVPPTDPKGGLVYGRIVQSDGKPAADL